MTKILFASLPRSGRNYIAGRLTEQGITVIPQCVTPADNLDHSADIIMSHDFNLDIVIPGRHIMKILRSPQDCMKSWYLANTKISKMELSRKRWAYRQKELRPYVDGFLKKYQHVHTVYFHDLIRDPNLILVTIAAILDKPFTRIPIPAQKHVPENLKVYPFV